MDRVGTKKMINMDFHEILPLYQVKSESKEYLGYFDVEFFVFTRQLILIFHIFIHTFRLILKD